MTDGFMGIIMEIIKMESSDACIRRSKHLQADLYGHRDSGQQKSFAGSVAVCYNVARK